MSEASAPLRLTRVGEYVWEIPRQGGMRVPARVYASEKLIEEVRDDPALAQLANVAHLPGIVGHALAMPDIHWGYGFPIGGVAAVDAEKGVITPGGIGFDVTCGVRLVRTGLEAAAIGPHLSRLADALFQAIPAGVGSKGAIPKLTLAEEKQLLARGARWAVARDFGRPSDLEATEDRGCFAAADPGAVSETALERGRPQLGTLGSGNHFLEVQEVAEIYDVAAAAALGLHPGQATVMIHSGSRGLGYQVCDARLRAATSGAPAPSPLARSTRHHPRRHGPLLVPPPRHGGRDGRDVRHHLPRSGARDESRGGDEGGTWDRSGERARHTGRHGARTIARRARRGDAVGLQGRCRRGRRRPRGGD